MARIYFWETDITIEKSSIGNTQPTYDVPGTSPESPQKVLTSEIYKAPSGDPQGTNLKIEKNEKLFPLFTGGANI